MTSGFDANVPARKPRPISRVLSELTAVPENGHSPSRIEPAAVAPPAAPKRSAPVARGYDMCIPDLVDERRRFVAVHRRRSSLVCGPACGLTANRYHGLYI